MHKTHMAMMICETTLRGLAHLDPSAPGLGAEAALLGALTV